jgi:hypothetical protein
VEPNDLKAQAESWVVERTSRLRGSSYRQLLAHLDQPIHEELRTASGKTLIRETQVFWDGGRDGPLRVMVDVWDPQFGGKRRWSRGSQSLAIDDFILAPEGTFIGEDPGAAAGAPA